jgi:osmotically inducible protein OsmC
MPMKKTLYTAHATAIGGRAGKAETDDKKISVQLSRPGSGEPGTNPEQLFASGYSACFGSAVEFVAKQQKLDVGQVKVQADVILFQGEDGFSLGVVLDVTLPGIDQPTAQKIVTAAHQVCPYSKAIRNNIVVTLKANGQELAKAA